MLVTENAVQFVKQSTPWWLVALPAFTGLLGAVIVALFQRTSEARKCRKDVRLKAYEDLVAASHEFNIALTLIAEGEGELVGRPKTALHGVAQRASVVSVCGPTAATDAANLAQDGAQEIVQDFCTTGRVDAIEDWATYRLAQEYVALMDSFTVVTSEELRTDRLWTGL